VQYKKWNPVNFFIYILKLLWKPVRASKALKKRWWLGSVPRRQRNEGHWPRLSSCVQNIPANGVYQWFSLSLQRSFTVVKNSWMEVVCTRLIRCFLWSVKARRQRGSDDVRSQGLNNNRQIRHVATDATTSASINFNLYKQYTNSWLGRRTCN